jgi:hypothetical protein
MTRVQRLAKRVKNLQAQLDEKNNVLRYDHMTLFDKGKFIKAESMHLRHLAFSFGDQKITKQLVAMVIDLNILGDQILNEVESTIQQAIEEIQNL